MPNGVTYSGTRPAPWLARAVNQFVPDAEYYASFKIAPTISSPVDKGTLPVIPRETLAADGSTTRRAPGAAYKRDSLAAEGVAYTCVGYGKEVPVPEEHVAIYGGIMNALQVAAGKIRTAAFTDLEERMEALIFNTTTWTGASLYTDNSSAPWDTAGSDVIGHVVAARDKVRSGTGMMPNALILNYAQYQNLIYTNTAIKALVSNFASPTPDVIDDVLKRLFRLPQIIVAGSVLNSAKEGQTASMADVWSDDYAMVAKVATTADPSEACVARTLQWQAMGTGTDMAVNIYDEPQTNSRVVQGNMYLDEIVVDAAFGHLMKIDA
jgi:hypothetical protein